MKPTKVTLTFDNGSPPIELPMLTGNLGPDVIDIRDLGKHGVFTYDPGFLSTASCHSEITYIDGEEGLLVAGVDAQGFLQPAGGAGDGHGVAGPLVVEERHLSVVVQRGPHHLRGGHGLALGVGHRGGGQLRVDGAYKGLRRVIGLQVAEAQVDGAAAAVAQGQGAADFAQIS